MGKTGDLREIQLTIEWKIKNFSSLSQAVDSQYVSPKFRYSDTSWELRIYANGDTDKAKGWLSLYLAKVSSGPPLTIDYALSIKYCNRQTDPLFKATYTFNENGYGWGRSQFMSRSELLERRSKTMPSDILTVICNMKDSEPIDINDASSTETAQDVHYSMVSRNSMVQIGDVCETLGEVKIEWKIKDFFSLVQERKMCYHSPNFYFSGTSWHINIYSESEVNDTSENWIGLHLTRLANGCPISIEFSLNLKTDEEEKAPYIRSTKDFYKKGDAWGSPNFILRREFTERKSKLVPSDILTVICTLKNTDRNDVNGSLFSRHEEVVDNLREIYEKAKRTDCTLKVDGQDIRTHRMILETRSPVFAAMFNHDTKENQTGEIFIDDIEKTTMDIILEYMYTGDIHYLTNENVLPIYAAAEKYDVKDLTKICSEFILRNLSVDWICDVIKFSELYEGDEINIKARNFFKENARIILKTEKWKKFAKQNIDIGFELLGSLVMDFLPQ